MVEPDGELGACVFAYDMVDFEYPVLAPDEGRRANKAVPNGLFRGKDRGLGRGPRKERALSGWVAARGGDNNEIMTHV